MPVTSWVSARAGVTHVRRTAAQFRILVSVARGGGQVRARWPAGRAGLAYARRYYRQAAVYRGGPEGPSLYRHAAGLRAVRARAAGDHVRSAAGDDPAVRGLLDRGDLERVLPAGGWGRRGGEPAGLLRRAAPG